MFIQFNNGETLRIFVSIARFKRLMDLGILQFQGAFLPATNTLVSAYRKGTVKDGRLTFDGRIYRVARYVS